MNNSSTLSSIGRLGKSLNDYKKDAVPMTVPLTALGIYKRQSRLSMDPDALAELAETIKKVGILMPLLVRPRGDGEYEIIAGHRRWRAAIMAGLTEAPVLVKTLDDETVDQIHLYENIHRENLSTSDMATRVQADLDIAEGNLAIVAEKYGKQKAWVSKMSSIARGGELMTELIEENVTADRAVLAAVSGLERSDPAAAKELVEKIKAAPVKADKRALTVDFAKSKKDEKKAEKAKAMPEPEWRMAEAVVRNPKDACTLVELSPHSVYRKEFEALSLAHHGAYLSETHRHPNSDYAVVEFGPAGSNRRIYKADELRLLQVL